MLTEFKKAKWAETERPSSIFAFCGGVVAWVDLFLFSFL